MKAKVVIDHATATVTYEVKGCETKEQLDRFFVVAVRDHLEVLKRIKAGKINLAACTRIEE